jgi:hypothetical protein
MYRVLGATLTALLSAVTFTLVLGGMAVELARKWQSNETVAGLGMIGQFSVRVMATLVLVALWVYGLARFFRFIGWPQWWAMPYVVLILCPSAWVFARRIEEGGDFMALFALQLPVCIVYVLHVRKLNKSVGRE